MTWGHGGFGTIIIEPVGSTYHDPKTGQPDPERPASRISGPSNRSDYGVNGSFRELMVQLNDSVPHTVNIVTAGNPPGQPIEVALEAGKTVSFPMPENIPMSPMPFLNGGTHTTGSGSQLQSRADLRPPEEPTRTIRSSSAARSTEIPYTPMVRAYLGDTVVFRLLQTMANETMVWTLSGHTFLTERYAGDANRKNSIHVGIAERYDLVVPQAGGPRLQPGDYIHFNGRASHFSEGAWGIVRVLDKEVPDLQKAAGRLQRAQRDSQGAGRVSGRCAGQEFQRRGDRLSVDEVQSESAGRHRGRFRADDSDGQSAGQDLRAWRRMSPKWLEGVQPMPLTIRANVGDCLKVKLTNKMKESRASFSAIGLAFDPKDSLGANVGNNPGDQTIAPGESRVYTYYADPFLGEIASLVWDWGNVMTESAQRTLRSGSSSGRRAPRIGTRRPARTSPTRTAGSPT